MATIGTLTLHRMRPPTIRSDRRQRPCRGRAFGGQVAQGQRERAPPGILCGHPAKVEMNALHGQVAAAGLQIPGKVRKRLIERDGSRDCAGEFLNIGNICFHQNTPGVTKCGKGALGDRG